MRSAASLFGGASDPGRSSPQPAPKTRIAARLELLREQLDYSSLRAFWKEMGVRSAENEEWKRPSYESARNYHYDRQPPIEYLIAVSRCFNVRLEWLATGEGEIYPERETLRENEAESEMWQAVDAAFTEALPVYPQLLEGTRKYLSTLLTDAAVAELRLSETSTHVKDTLVRAAGKAGRAINAALGELDSSNLSAPVLNDYVVVTACALRPVYFRISEVALLKELKRRAKTIQDATASKPKKRSGSKTLPGKR